MPIKAPPCIIQSCNRRVGGSRFRFQANPKRKKLWLKALHLNQEYITVKDPRVCEKHFKPSDFKSNLWYNKYYDVNLIIHLNQVEREFLLK